MKGRRFFLLVPVLLAAGVMLWWGWIMTPPGTGREAEFTLQRGWGVRTVAGALEDSGFVKSRYAVLWRYRRAFAPAPLLAGKYLLSDTMTVDTLLGRLTRGEVIPVPTHWVTLPPGLRMEQSLAVLAEQMDKPLQDFLDVAGDPEFLSVRGLPSLEGYLYPETFEFADTLTARQVLSRVVAEGEKVRTAEWEASCTALGLSPEEAVVLASIVEREGQVDEERPLIAGVFLLRLRRGMRLESCATVQYALGEVRERLLYRDLEVQSPYNTYLRPGLPPGPICSPGAASLLAVAHPDTLHRYLFFVSRGDGSGLHLFARTGTEHAANVRSVR